MLVAFTDYNALSFDPVAGAADPGIAFAIALLTFGVPILGHLIVANRLAKHPDDRARLAALSLPAISSAT
ncbi:hypothetical protein [Erythrobacter sp.]|uniref:hypothetical protein n=1 Tax=Erythrobacter sp. TaxID=1042 RepID=UPI003FA5C416